MHPAEPTYPCCLPALGEFSEMTPHEGSTGIVPAAPTPDGGPRAALHDSGTLADGGFA